MLSFRQKLFISYALIFLVFISLMFPFVSTMVEKIVVKAMEDRATEIIAKIQSAPNDEELVQMIKDEKTWIFFRVSIINDKHQLLYDTHTKRLFGEQFSQEFVVNHPEVNEAFEKGKGFYEGYSELLGQNLTYLATAFDFHGKKYVLRTAFPYKYISDVAHDVEIGFITLATIVLLSFSFLTWFIINHITKPIQQIIRIVKPYQNGMEATLPEIKINASSKDDFGRLANTFNSLSEKIKKHIDTLTEERNEKEAVLESLIEGVIAVDPSMHIIFANTMALKLLGLEPQQVIGQPCSIISQPTCCELLLACQRENIPLTDTITIKNDRAKIFLDIVAAPKKENAGAVLVMQDKTSHYKLLEMRKDFIANASHELKTPITIIRGFAETLHDNPELPQETSQTITEKIVKNCQRMTILIKDLLTLADVENIPEHRLIECDLYEIVQHCCDLLKPAFPDAIIKINKTPDQDFILDADPNLMEMAIMNLIENAAKYSNRPAEITIGMKMQNHLIKLTIEDKGIGIPAADLEHIFQRFYTVNKAHSQRMGGSGLGLSIVETIIEKHYGKISVESQLGVGTKFTILLPSLGSNTIYQK